MGGSAPRPGIGGARFGNTWPMGYLRLAAIAASAIALAGCSPDTGEDGPSQSLAPSTTAATSAATDASTTAAFRGGTEPVKRDDGRGANDALNMYTDLRLARQPGFDRFVIEFSGEVPGEYEVTYADTPNYDQCAEEPVEGPAFLTLRAHTTSIDVLSERRSYSGPDRLRTDTTVITEVLVTCDFEAVSHIVLGVRHRAPFRVLELQDPPRLVIDVEAR